MFQILRITHLAARSACWAGSKVTGPRGLLVVVDTAGYQGY